MLPTTPAREAPVPEAVPPVSLPAPLSLREATKAVLEVLEEKAGEPFDRQAFEARFSATERPVQIGLYDRVKFSVAREQFRSDPTGLTDGDIAQLTVVDPTLGAKAAAARVGFVEKSPSTGYDGLDNVPCSVALLLAVVAKKSEDLALYVSTAACLAREARVRLDQFEAAPKASSAVTAETKIAALWNHVERLEARLAEAEANKMVYRGVWSASETYERGAIVTSDGSMWHASAESKGVKPGVPDIRSRVWVLCVKRGADGKAGRDAR